MLPILGAGVVDKDEVIKMSTASVISRLLELAILGGIFIYTTVQVMNSKIGALEDSLQKHEATCVIVKQDITKLKSDVALNSWRLNKNEN